MDFASLTPKAGNLLLTGTNLCFHASPQTTHKQLLVSPRSLMESAAPACKVSARSAWEVIVPSLRDCKSLHYHGHFLPTRPHAAEGCNWGGSSLAVFGISAITTARSHFRSPSALPCGQASVKQQLPFQ
eukprot:4720052-Amphidinium_carterae.1